MEEGLWVEVSHHCKSEDAELRAENAKEAGNLTSGRELPLDRVFTELPQCWSVQHREKTWKILGFCLKMSENVKSRAEGAESN